MAPSQDVDLWTDDLKEELDVCLETVRVQSSGSFAHFEALKDVPNPGLQVKDIGSIGLPLSERDAKAIISASHQAPFGKGTETIVDVDVRRTWELSPTDFSLKNVAWEGMIASVVQRVGKELGVYGTGIRAELYKLLLYEEGAMFKPHQDSEKCPGMFGTLVIALPSKHEGGDVHVTHAGRTLIFQTSNSSEFDFSFLTWYSDVLHEVKPIVSGHRLVLTYNLVHTATGIARPAANSANSISELKSLLSRWKSSLEGEKQEGPQTLSYLFEHRYTNASLSFDTLKGHDHEVASQLKEACREMGFYFCLANCERTIMGGCDEDFDDWGYGGGYGYYDEEDDEEDDDEDDNRDENPAKNSARDHHPIVDEIERSMELKHVVELDGTKIAEEVQYDEKWIIQTDPFEDEDPDDEDYEGYTGNEGCSTTLFYRRTIGIIMPPSARVPFFLHARGHRTVDGVPEINIWLDRLFKVTSMNPGSDLSLNAGQEIDEMCRLIISETKSWKSSKETATYSWQVRQLEPFPAAVLERVVLATVELNDYALFKDSVNLRSGKLPVPLYNSLGVMVRRYQKDELREITISELQSLNSFAQRYEALLNLSKGFLQENGDSVACPMPEFFDSQLHLAMAEMDLTSVADGVALARWADLEVREPTELFDIIVPAVKRNIQSVSVVAAFLTEIMNSVSKGNLSENNAHTIFKDLVKDFHGHFRLDTIAPFNEALPNKRVRTTFGYRHPLASWQNPGSQNQESPEIGMARKTGENIAALLHHCLRLDLKTELKQLLSEVIRQAQSVRVDAFHDLLLPLLRHLREISQEDDMSPFRNLFKLIIVLYAVRYVRPEPQPPTNWTRQRKGCSCNDCGQLDRFIIDPNAKVRRFSMAEKRRRHLSDRVGDEYIQETERIGSPHTLVLIKTLKVHQAEKKAWQQRVATGVQHIRNIGPEASVRALLENIFEPAWSLDIKQILSLGLVKLSSEKADSNASANTGTSIGSSSRLLGSSTSSTLPPLGTASASHTNQATQPLLPITNRKRPATIDLTEDSD